MNKAASPSVKPTPHPGIFSLLKPYSGMVTLLIIMALLGSGINILIPKIIAHGIDTYSAGTFNVGSVITQFLLAATAIFVFTLTQNVLQTYASEKVAKDLRTKLSEDLSTELFLRS